MKFFVGLVDTYVGVDGNTYLTRLPPQQHPEIPDMVATQVVNIRGFKWIDTEADDLTGVNTNIYEYADLTVLYESVPYLVLDDAELENGSEINRYFELFYGDEIQSSADYITIPAGSMSYIKSDGTNKGTVPFNSGIVQPVETIRAAWHRLPDSLFDSDAPKTSVLFQRLYTGYDTGDGLDTDGEPTLAYIGTVNSEPILNFAAGTLLLNSVVPRRLRSPTGIGFEWRLIMEWLLKPAGWLNLVRRQNDADDGVYFVGRGTTYYTPATLPDEVGLYNTRDHNNVFDLN